MKKFSIWDKDTGKQQTVEADSAVVVKKKDALHVTLKVGTQKIKMTGNLFCEIAPEIVIR